MVDSACAREFFTDQGETLWLVFRFEDSPTFQIRYRRSFAQGWQYWSHVDKPEGMTDNDALDAIERCIRGGLRPDNDILK